ncbi:hypothetical protein ACX1NX_08470 [Acinetobacter sp. ANC 5383]
MKSLDIKPILCFVIRQPYAPHNVQQLREKMRQVQQGSIPDYAFKQPHFRETLANQWIEAYFQFINRPASTGAAILRTMHCGI